MSLRIKITLAILTATSVTMGMMTLIFFDKLQKYQTTPALLSEELYISIFGTALIVTLISFVCAFFFSRAIVSPIIELCLAINKIKEGHIEILVPHKDRNDEIGELSRMIELLRKSFAELNTAKKKAEDLSFEKSDFLATMSHEIRTQMSGVLGMAQLIMDTRPSQKIERYTNTVMKSGESLMQIINDILDFSKIEAGKLELDLVPVDMMELVDDVSSLFSVNARDKGLEIVVRYSPSDEQFVYADPVRVRQILSNLVSNAIKFTNKGQITIAIEEQKTNVTKVDSNLVNLKFSVMDTGIGLSKEAQAKLFQKFSQADSSTTRKHGGTGLGLSICKSLAELMGGEIAVESDERQGATFWFTLSFKRNTHQVGGGSHHQEKQSSDILLKGVKVLVAEDNRVNQVFIEEVLKEIGVECTMVSNGIAALEAVKQNDFDLIIMDCLMPEMDGFAASRAICDFQEERGLESIPIIALTANAMKGDREKCFEAGMNEYLTKPVHKKNLERMVVSFVTGQEINGEETKSGGQESVIEEVSNDLLDEDSVENARSILNDKYEEMVHLFITNSWEAIEEIDQAINQNDIEAIIRPAHTLKSTSKQMGAIKLSNRVKDLECKAKSIETSDKEAIKMISEALEKVKSTLTETMCVFGQG